MKHFVKLGFVSACVFCCAVFAAVAGDLSFSREMFEDHRAVMLLIAPEDGQIRNANRAAERFYGYTHEQLVGMNIFQLNELPPQDIRANMQAALDSMQNVFQFRHRLANGELREVEVYCSPVDVDGERTLFSIIQDATPLCRAMALAEERAEELNRVLARQAETLTWRTRALVGLMGLFILGQFLAIYLLLRAARARRRADASVREQAENFRAFFETVDLLIVVTSPEGDILYANPVVSGRLGYVPEELDGLKIFALAPPDREQEVRETFAAMVRDEVSSSAIPLMGKQGVRLPVKTRTWRGVWNGKEALFSISKDLSAEQDARLWFEHFFRTNPGLMAVTALPENTFVDVNDTWLSVMGYARDEVIGQTVADLHLFLNPEDKNRAIRLLEERGFLRNFETCIRTKQGTILEGSFSGEVVYDKGKPYLLTVMLDLTERYRAERKLQETNRHLSEETARANTLATRAEMASVAKSAFLANMSHEIRTPMNGVLGFLDLLISTGLDDTQRRYADIAKSSGHILLSLINDILDITKVEAGKMTLETMAFNLHEVVRNTVEQMEIRAREKGLELTVEIGPEVSEHVLGDPKRIQQVLLNLTHNAIKFTDAGFLSVRVSRPPMAETGSADAALVRFEVWDTGIGVNAKRADELFAPFTQADDSVVRKYGGSGLGLAIVRQLSELMGGASGLESPAPFHEKPACGGPGSLFWFTAHLPPTEAPERLAAMREHAPSALAHAARVLLVDDDEVCRALGGTILRALGCHVEMANDGLEALEKLEQGPFDMVFMDVQMPRMDGLTAAETIRRWGDEDGVATPEELARRRRKRDIPIIAMTALAMEGDREKCLRAGMNDYISKPINSGDIKEKLETWVLSPDESERTL